MTGAAPIGCCRWAIAEGYIPTDSAPQSDPRFASHETACILNAGEAPAQVSILIYFADREPAGPYAVAVPPRRTLHLRFDELQQPERIPRDTDYSAVIESDVPVVVQHTRLDSRREALALLSTTAYADRATSEESTR